MRTGYCGSRERFSEESLVAALALVDQIWVRVSSPVFRLGFSGASPVTDAQEETLRGMMSEYPDHVVCLHDGHQHFSSMARAMAMGVERVPPSLSRRPRLRRLVFLSDHMLVAPSSKSLTRETSWAAVKQMWWAGKPVWVVLPDGSVKRRREEFSW